MTEKLLSSTNQDQAHNGPTRVLDLTEQLSCIVQEFNIFITSHSDVASETDQNLGQLKTIGMQLKGQQTAYMSSKAPTKLYPHPLVGCAQLKKT